MPVGWGGDVDDVGARLMDELAPVIEGLDVDLKLRLGSFDGALQVLLVNIAHGQQTISFRCGEMAGGTTDAAHADDSFGQLVARGDETFAA